MHYNDDYSTQRRTRLVFKGLDMLPLLALDARVATDAPVLEMSFTGVVQLAARNKRAKQFLFAHIAIGELR